MVNERSKQPRARRSERVAERLAFATWIDEFARENSISSTTRVWLERRFLNEVDRRRRLERRWRYMFWCTRYVILSGSLILPVLITASKSVTWLNPVGIIVSIIVALATAMETLLRTGQKWRLYRQGADNISTEGAAFFQMIGRYAISDPAKRMQEFKTRVEGLIEDLHNSYLTDAELAISQRAPSSGA
jgi:hypothetical protein